VASGKLASNSVFKEYFRGLYFKMEKSGRVLEIQMLNLKQVKSYNEDLSTTVGAVTTHVSKKTIVLDFTGNSVCKTLIIPIADLLIMLCQI
jgi:hypothetical protein